MSDIAPDIIFKATDLIVEHVNDLWVIAAGLVAVKILIIAHVVSGKKVKVKRQVLSWLLSISVLMDCISIAAGYFAKAAVIVTMIDYAKVGSWVESAVAENLTMVQAVCLTIALVIFAVGFAAYSAVLAESMVKAQGGE